MENSTQVKKPSETTLLNFMLNARVECRIVDPYKPVFAVEAMLDTAYGGSPREALQQLYALRRDRTDAT